MFTLLVLGVEPFSFNAIILGYQEIERTEKQRGTHAWVCYILCVDILL